ncbi:hypothetical protein [Bacillus cereus]|nr:hypothetical protein [Bacillus cereus]
MRKKYTYQHDGMYLTIGYRQKTDITIKKICTNLLQIKLSFIKIQVN